MPLYHCTRCLVLPNNISTESFDALLINDNDRDEFRDVQASSITLPGGDTKWALRIWRWAYRQPASSLLG